MSDGAVVAIVTGCVSIVATVVTFLTLWVKLKYGVEKTASVETKLDTNTELTRAGTAAAARNAAQAASAANVAATAAFNIDKKLNGGVESSITAAVEPIRANMTRLDAAVREHAAQDAANMDEIRLAIREAATNTMFKDLTEYVHDRNHDMLGAINAQSVKLDLVLKMLETAKFGTALPAPKRAT